MTPDEFRALAMTQPETDEGGHMGKSDFRVRKRIFATLDQTRGIGVLKLGSGDQALMMSHFDAVSPAAGAWGAKGWTEIRLNGIDAAAMPGWMRTAWTGVAPKTLVKARTEEGR